MKSKKRKMNTVKVSMVLFFIIILIIGMYWYFKNQPKLGIPGEERNTSYQGKGQEKGNKEEGYPTTFITEEQNQKVYLEYKQNGKAPWSNHSYWGGTMAENGCGITAMSIIASGYGKKATPEMLRKNYLPHLEDETIANIFKKNFEIQASDFYYDTVSLGKEKILEHLTKNKPILICVWNKPNERWTTKSHFMVLLATDGKENVYVSNPKEELDKSKISGWYPIEEIVPYLAKAIYILE